MGKDKGIMPAAQSRSVPGGGVQSWGGGSVGGTAGSLGTQRFLSTPTPPEGKEDRGEVRKQLQQH